MPDPGLYAANVAALARLDPPLALRVELASPEPGVESVISKSGHAVPRMGGAGRAASLHSAVDPVREARRAAEALPRGEYVVCLGLGGGYLLAAFLARSETQRALVIESSAGMLRSLFGAADFRALLEDPRVRLVAAPDPDDIEEILLADYLPAVYRSFCTVPLRTRVRHDPLYFSAVGRAAERALEAASRDYAVQARFGWRWLRNTLANLRALEHPAGRAAPSPTAGALESLRRRAPGSRFLVTGAGPSLEGQMPRIRELRASSILLATDASLLPLLRAGITPDAVLSVDCQHVAYHHFLAGLPGSCLLVLDLASPPLLGRISPRVVYVSTLHPFSRHLVSRGLDLPYVDVSGGNVSHAAVSLADTLGAEEVRLFGVDLSFPDGKPYARGCFLYPAFASRADRLSPLESSIAGFVLASPNTRRVPARQGFAYVTETMASYRAHLERLARSTRALLVQEEGLGPPLHLAGAPRQHPPAGVAADAEPSAPRAGPSVHELLGAYAMELQELPLPRQPFPGYLRGLSGAQRGILSTLLPVVAARQGALGYPPLARALGEAAGAVLKAVREALSALPPHGGSA